MTTKKQFDVTEGSAVLFFNNDGTLTGGLRTADGYYSLTSEKVQQGAKSEYYVIAGEFGQQDDSGQHHVFDTLKGRIFAEADVPSASGGQRPSWTGSLVFKNSGTTMRISLWTRKSSTTNKTFLSGKIDERKPQAAGNG